MLNTHNPESNNLSIEDTIKISLKISKGQSESIIRRLENTMA